MGLLKAVFGDFAEVKIKDEVDSILPPVSKTGFEDVATEVLRNLWMAKFGSRGITFLQLAEVRGEDINMVAMELYKRKQVKREVVQRPDVADSKIFYILEKEQNGDH